MAKAEKNTIKVNEGAIAIAISSLICFLGTQAAIAVGWPDAGTKIFTSSFKLLIMVISKAESASLTQEYARDICLHATAELTYLQV